LEDLVYDAFKIAKVQFQDHQINSYVDWDSSLPTWVKGDPTRLRQVLLNLLNNAVKFTEKGSVEIRLELAQTIGDIVWVKFRVIDTGIGIPKEKQHLVFRRFAQVDGETTRKYGGTGLGLAISRQLVEMMQGQFGIESALGRGPPPVWVSITSVL